MDLVKFCKFVNKKDRKLAQAVIGFAYRVAVPDSQMVPESEQEGQLIRKAFLHNFLSIIAELHAHVYIQLYEQDEKKPFTRIAKYGVLSRALN